MLLIASLSFRISSSNRFGYVIYYYNIKMLLTLGYVLAGVILYEVLMKDDSPSGSRCEHMTSSDDAPSGRSDTSFKVKEEVGSLKLPPCNLVAVQLGPSEDKKKAVLTLYLENKTSPHETFKPVSDLRTKKYVKLFPTYYATGITLESKGVPITAYYSSVL